MGETLSPFAGKPVDATRLVDLPHLITAYFTDVPDPALPAQRVSFGTSGHRGQPSIARPMRTISWQSPRRFACTERRRA